ncbi:MAG: hypothetical protein ABI166_15520, partial [Mucilaginibacter sp.]
QGKWRGKAMLIYRRQSFSFEIYTKVELFAFKSYLQQSFLRTNKALNTLRKNRPIVVAMDMLWQS